MSSCLLRRKLQQSVTYSIISCFVLVLRYWKMNMFWLWTVFRGGIPLCLECQGLVSLFSEPLQTKQVNENNCLVFNENNC